MTDEIKREKAEKLIEELRELGYAVAVLPPWCIPSKVDVSNLENLMENRGFDAL